MCIRDSYYGTAQAFGINIDRTLAAVFIVSINTGAYMSEIVRGGIFAVDKGQFEAATALGFTPVSYTHLRPESISSRRANLGSNMSN